LLPEALDNTTAYESQHVGHHLAGQAEQRKEKRIRNGVASLMWFQNLRDAFKDSISSQLAKMKTAFPGMYVFMISIEE
jgi:hypothetical protein